MSADLRSHISTLLPERRAGFSLPQPFYTDEGIFKAELEAVFATNWLFACNEAELKSGGDYITLEIGTDSVIVLRDKRGVICAFHNVCRHRGSRICNAPKGKVSRLVCPYHRWVYELDGSLFNGREMGASFDRSPYGLKRVRVENVAGLVYICLSDNPPSLARFKDAVAPYIAPHQPARTKVAFESTIIEDANWKLVIENNRECYHCVGNHPELMASLVEFALPDDKRGGDKFRALMERSEKRWDACGLPHRPAEGGDEFRCVRLPFTEGSVSFTPDGTPACTKLLGDLMEPDLGSVRMFLVPNNWNHFLSDHILHFRVLPISVDRTAVRTTWLVRDDAIEGVDYDIETLTSVWLATNDQDRQLAENNQRGVQSSAYRPGPYMPSEFMLNHFTDWYARMMTDYSVQGAPALAAAE
jgi:Rieske 2Fe-2S family protein